MIKTDRQKDRHRIERQTGEKYRDTETQKVIQKNRDTDTDTETNRIGETGTERHRDRDTDTERGTERKTKSGSTC